MSKWIEEKLADICLQEKGAIISGPFGSNISSKYFVSKGVPVIRGNNLSLNLDKFYDDGFVFVTEQKAEELNCYAVEGDLLFTAAGTIGQVGILQAPLKYKQYVISNKQMRARIDTSKVGLLYAYYWYSSPWMQDYFIRNNKGSTVPLITLSELKEAPIRYPESIQEQQAIVEAIERISKKIDLNREICGELESMAKTLYDYWFVQFDFPDDNGKPYRASGGEMVWNEQLKREIPKGWSAKKLNQLADYGQVKAVNIDSDHYVGMDNMLPNMGGIVTSKYFPAETGNVAFECGDILLGNIRPYFKKLWLSDIDGGCSPDVLAIHPKNKEISTFIFCTLGRDTFFDYDVKGCKGTKMPRGDKAHIMNYLFSFDESIALRFSQLADALFRKMQMTRRESIELAKLRDWLLPMLMNGQATVVPAEPAPKLQVLQPEKPARDPRFDRWLQTQGVAARGTVDEQTLHDIFDAMDDDDKQ